MNSPLAGNISSASSPTITTSSVLSPTLSVRAPLQASSTRITQGTLKEGCPLCNHHRCRRPQDHLQFYLKAHALWTASNQSVIISTREYVNNGQFVDIYERTPTTFLCRFPHLFLTNPRYLEVVYRARFPPARSNTPTNCK